MKTDQAIQLFILECQLRRLKPKSINLYKLLLEKFNHHCVQQNIVNVEDIATVIAKQYIVSLLDKSVAYQRIVITVMKMFNKFCLDEGLTKQTIVIKLPRVEDKIKPAFTKLEVKTILKACKSKKHYLLCLFLLDSGVRANELCQLDITDIDLIEGTVKVRHGKTGERIIVIGLRVRKLLILYLKDRMNGPLFITHSKQRFTTHSIVSVMRMLRKRTGIKHCTAHCFRRTFALNCLRQGMSEHVIAKLMGHKNTNMLRQYLDIQLDDLKFAHSKTSPADNL